MNGVYPRNDDGVAPAAPRVRCCRPAACFPFHGSPPALGVPRAPGMRKPPHARAHAVFRPPARHSVCPLKPRARLLLSSGNSSSGLSLALSPSASSLCSASALQDMPGRLVSRPLPPIAPSLCPVPRFWKPGEVLRSVLQLGDAAASSVRPAGSETPADASVLGDVFHLSWSSQHLSRLSEDVTCARQVTYSAGSVNRSCLPHWVVSLWSGCLSSNVSRGGDAVSAGHSLCPVCRGRSVHRGRL